MDAPNPYEQLGVAEESSFEEIREVRDRLSKEAAGNQGDLERIESAYDAILRDRLRARIEGKIKVPDRIRFAEKSVADVIGEKPSASSSPTPHWLVRSIDHPDRYEMLTSLAIFGGLGILGYALNSTLQVVSTLLSFGLIASFYLLYRKEKRFGRALLFTAIGLTIGAIFGYFINQTFPDTASLNLMASLLFWLWLVTTFAR